MTGVGKQGGILSCDNVSVARHGHAEHKAQHGGGNKPVGADAKRFPLAWLGARGLAYGGIVFVTHFAKQGEEFGRLLFYSFQFVFIHIVLSFLVL